MKIRFVKNSDATALTSIYNHYIQHTEITFETKLIHVDEMLRRMNSITQKYPWLVIEHDQQILGYAYLSPFNPRTAYDWSADLAIYLNHEVSAKGLGTLLYNAIEECAIAQGFGTLISLITAQNQRSINFHIRHGFSEAGCFDKIGYKFNWCGVYFYTKCIQNLTTPPTPVASPNLQYEKNFN